MRMYVFWNWDQKKMDKPNQKKKRMFSIILILSSSFIEL